MMTLIHANEHSKTMRNGLDLPALQQRSTMRRIARNGA